MLTEGTTLPAKVLPGMHDERVVLIEERRVRREGSLEKVADVLVGFCPIEETVTFENATGISIDDENGVAAGVEENGVGGLRADTMDGEQLLAKVGSGSGKEFVE